MDTPTHPIILAIKNDQALLNVITQTIIAQESAIEAIDAVRQLLDRRYDAFQESLTKTQQQQFALFSTVVYHEIQSIPDEDILTLAPAGFIFPADR